ncbi:type I polyketide synthase [Kitasatospora sp. MAA19]|uniref:type I polyketide synthase n=1 Tax=Kitasatospora sp. MAA19 TaxID=3035090 RepID=UPI00247373B4|nr:type I polyketide synthase [Kitasatospora sp. MAA19]
MEAQALQATYGQNRQQPLWLGSVKSNIGHTQAAAGAAGIIKMVMAMRHGVLPRTLHVTEPTTEVDWTAGAVSLLTEQQPWPAHDRPRRAAVSSFGISGTNAHVILEQPPQAEIAAPERNAPALVPWLLSASTPAALSAQATRLTAAVAPGDSSLDVGWSLATGRAALDHRAVVLAGDGTDRVEALRALARGEAHPQVVTGRGDRGTLAMVFSGQGSQRLGMGRELYDTYPVYADAFDAVCAAIELPHPLRDIVFGDDPDLLNQTQYTQPALFALQIALYRLWEHWGITPDVITGHSIGEIAAAHITGILTLTDAATLITHRARLMQALPQGGAMVAITTTEDDIRPHLHGHEHHVGIAAINSPTSLVLSGDHTTLTEIIDKLPAHRTTWLRVSHAFHSPLMEPILDELRDTIRQLTLSPPTIPLISTLTGQPIDHTDPEHWIHHTRHTVRFADTITHTPADTYLEIGPSASLTPHLPTNTIASLNPKHSDTHTLTTALAHLTAHGANPHWDHYFTNTGAQRTPLPTYPFQHTRYWLDGPAQEVAAESGADTDFWRAVEHEDLDALAAMLTIGDQDPRQVLAPALSLISDWRRKQSERDTVDSWRYQVRWRPLSSSAAGPSAVDERHLVFVPADDPDDHLVAAVVEALPPETIRVPCDAGATRDSIAELLARHKPQHVVSLLALGGQPTAATLALLQACADVDMDGSLWCLTSGAVSVGRADRLRHPEQAAVWGLGQVAGLEHPRWWGGLIDLPERLDARASARLTAALTGQGDEDQLAVRPSGVFARRLTRAAGPSGEPTWSTDGAVLVTGGTGALGGHVARWLIRSGVRRVLLTSRRGSEAPGARELRTELEALAPGTRVDIEACDVADRSALDHLLNAVDTPITAVFHTAGIGTDAALQDTDAAVLAQAWLGKAEGARNLDDAFADAPLDAFVLFSSGAGVWGGRGQGAYAAANAYLDALAQARRDRGQHALAVAWGTWSGEGMAATGSAEETLRRTGLLPMEPALAVSALARALGGDDTTVTVAPIAWDTFAPVLSAARRRPLIGDLAEARTALDGPVSGAPGTGEDGWPERLSAATGTERTQALLELVRGEVAATLGHTSRDAISPQAAFRSLGIDSLTAVQLRNRLQAALGLSLPATLVFDYPSPASLAGYLKRELLGEDGPADSAGETVRSDDDPVVIVAMSCRLPGAAESPEALWDLVANGGDAVSEFPADRGWDLDRLYDPDPNKPGTSYARTGTFVADAAGFDAGLFGISPREALAMDPQQRLLLETSWEAFERAGIAIDTMRESRTGVFIGAATSHYAAGDAGQGSEGYLLTGTATAVLSGRVSYAFGLEGPAVTVDTACSSSLVAMHLAAQALRSGECSLALAGGVTVMATPAAFVEFSRQRGLAVDGRCKSFAAAADGTGWGEGVGVLVLERLSDARRLGHPVLAVLRGSAVNQDGASNGLSAPNGPSQQRVIRQALANAGLRPSEVDAVEAHGTGTRLGDPIEAQALLAAYGQDREQPLWLGSVKSNIGHTQSAAGVAGVIKMVLAMQHGILPRTLHVDEPTPHVDWTAGAVSLLTEDRLWPEPAGRPRRAGVSAFGVSGTNAHVILEQAPVSESADGGQNVPPVVPWVFSARDEQALRSSAGRLAEHAVDEAGALDTGYSLATSRALLTERAVVVSRDPQARRQALQAFADGRTTPDVITGRGDKGTLAMVFSGQGSQRLGMGRELYDTYPAYADAFDAVCAAIELPHPLRDIIFGDDETLLNQTQYTQPALFALQVALYRLWEHWGITPDVVTGHSIGEIAAAHITGILTLTDAATLITHRARLMQALPQGGAMVAITTIEDDIRPLLHGHEHLVGIAAINSPTSLVLSGDHTTLTNIVDKLHGHRTTWLRVSHAFHSPLMEPILDELRAVISQLTLSPPAIPLISTLTGQPIDHTDPEHWIRHARHTVRFADAITHTPADTYLEIGPSASLTPHLPTNTTPSLRKDQPETHTLTTALAHLTANGANPHWDRYFTNTGAQRTPLPTYPFQHTRYWLDQSGTPQRDVSTVDAAESRFWDAVERQDLPALSRELGEDHGRLSDALPALADWRRRHREQSVVDSWRYRIAWAPLTVEVRRLSGTWLVVAAAAQHGHPDVLAVLAALGDGGAEPRLVDRVTADDGEVAGVVSLLAFDDEPDGTHPTMSRGLAATVALVQNLQRAGSTVPLWCLTRGAVSIGRSEPVHAPAQAQFWGMGRAVALEWPDGWGGLVDLPATLDERTLSRLPAFLAGGSGEDQLALRVSGVFGRRLTHAPHDSPAARTPWQPRGTVLITGGTGALGGHVARWLAGRGAEHLLLVGRSGPAAAGAAALEAELSAAGARVTIAACDVSDRAAVADLLAAVPQELPLTAVVHAAGLGQLTPLADLGIDEFAGIVRAKTAGATHLDELLGERELDAFVLFSSVSGVWGTGGQAAYGAANAHLDAIARNRRDRGLAATSVAWGPWAGEGMAQGESGEHMRRRGLPPIKPDLAIAALERATGDDEPCHTVADVQWEGFLPLFTSARPSALLSGLPEVRAQLSAAEEPRATNLNRFSGLGAAERRARLLATVTSEAAAVLGHATADRVAADRAFRDLGFDSLTAVDLRNRLGAVLGVPLPTTLVFDYPNPDSLVSHLMTLFGEDPQDDDGQAPVAASGEPLAVVGIGCRFPGGVRTPEDLWQLLVAGGDAVSGFPTDRGWDLTSLLEPDVGTQGGSTADSGGFLYDAAEFDAEFFGISPREARAMDPQQRLLLETAWETFERSGIDPRSLRGSRTGVFVGGNSQDYVSLLDDDTQGTEGHLLTGNTTSVASGRISYTFGLEGPAVTIDTACSSSLVAMHLAANALRNGECTMALAGGVTVMATPRTFVEFSRQGGLSPDGRCKAFSAGADGTGWGEGVGLLVLERLSDARRLGHPVLAVLRGSAVNQDGASNGLTAPNGPSQQRVIRQALANAALQPSDVDAVEAHGTGTRLGDPIEAQALLATYGQDREQPLWLGSVKSNIGHTQSAAGVAGVIKMVLAMQHGILPRTLHVDEPTPHVDWTAGAVSLLTEQQPWPAHDRPRRAGVSSFGISGTNAHVILEQPPQAEVAAPERNAPALVPWLLSGRDERAVRAQAARLAERLDDDGSALDVAYSLATTRGALEHRAVIVATDPADRAQALHALARGEAHPQVVTGRGDKGTLAMVFSGQGSQRLGMGRELYDTYPVYADAFDAVCAAIELPHPLRDIVFGDDPDLLNQTQYTQPALFALQIALYRLWEHWGITPDVVTGHSIGEIAAAHITGILTLTDAATLITHRARLMQALPQGGAMVAITTTEDDIRPHLHGHEHHVGIAAINSPTSLVLSGDHTTLTEIIDKLPAHRTTWLRVSHAFHSPLMEPILDQFRDTIRQLTFTPPTIPLISTLTGQPIDHTDPEHWIRHTRHTVRFADAITHTPADTYLEIGPSASLTPHLPTNTIASLNPKQNDTRSLTTALAHLTAHGANPHWDHYFTNTGAQRTPLPTYPFHGKRYWPDASAPRHGEGRSEHPLLTSSMDLAHSSGVLLTGRLSVASHPWLADHVVAGAIVFPGTAFVELVLHAAQRSGRRGFEELTLESPLVLPAEGSVDLQVAVGDPGADGKRAVTVHSRPDADAPWQLHATGTIGDEQPAEPSWSLTAWPPPGASALSVSDVYAEFAAAGLDYGPFFQGLRAAWRVGEDVAVEVELPEGEDRDSGLGVHPALLDSVLHGVGVDRMFGADGHARLPFSWAGVTVHVHGATRLRAVLSPLREDAIALLIADGTGRPVAEVERLTMRRISAAQFTDGRQSLFGQAWLPRELPSTSTEFTVLGAEDETPDATHTVLRVGNGDGLDPEDALETAAGVLETLRSHTQDRILVVVTSHAVAVDTDPAPAGAAVWGLVRAAQAEQPGRIVLVDLDEDERSWQALPHALSGGEAEFALRQGEMRVPRLVPAPTGSAAAPDWAASTVLITGAAGTLGALVAHHLVRSHGVTDLVLVSRHGDAPEPEGAEVTQLACDLTDRAQIAAALAAVPADRPLAVVHCAGTIDDAILARQTPGHLRRVFGPKATAAWHLHELTRDRDVTAFVLFSSAAATLGSPGQANYAAANAYLDALAHHRTTTGHPTTSLAWGPWTAGMAATVGEADRRRLSGTGLAPIDEATGRALFDASAATGGPVLFPMPVNRTALRRRAADAALPPVLRDLVPARATTASVSTRPLADVLRNLPPNEQRDRIAQLVLSRTAAVAGHDSGEAISMDRPFTEHGFDSLMAVELRGALDAATGLRLPATLVFDHPTPAALCEYLLSLLGPGRSAEPEAIFAEIDRLEVNLGRVGQRHAAQVRSRLRSLLNAWENADKDDRDDGAAELTAADLEDMFDIIDDELGLS